MQIQNYSYITYFNHRTSCWRIVHRPGLRRVHSNFPQRPIWIIWIIQGFQRRFWRSPWRLERSVWNIHRGTSALSFNGRKIWRSHSCKLPLGGWTYMFQNCVSSFWFKVILNVFYLFLVIRFVISFRFKVILNVFYLFLVIRFVIGVIFVVIFLFFVNWKKCK